MDKPQKPKNMIDLIPGFLKKKELSEPVAKTTCVGEKG